MGTILTLIQGCFKKKNICIHVLDFENAERKPKSLYLSPCPYLYLGIIDDGVIWFVVGPHPMGAFQTAGCIRSGSIPDLTWARLI